MLLVVSLMSIASYSNEGTVFRETTCSMPQEDIYVVKSESSSGHSQRGSTGLLRSDMVAPWRSMPPSKWLRLEQPSWCIAICKALPGGKRSKEYQSTSTSGHAEEADYAVLGKQMQQDADVHVTAQLRSKLETARSLEKKATATLEAFQKSRTVSAAVRTTEVQESAARAVKAKSELAAAKACETTTADRLQQLTVEEVTMLEALTKIGLAHDHQRQSEEAHLAALRQALQRAQNYIADIETEKSVLLQRMLLELRAEFIIRRASLLAAKAASRSTVVPDQKQPANWTHLARLTRQAKRTKERLIAKRGKDLASVARLFPWPRIDSNDKPAPSNVPETPSLVSQASRIRYCIGFALYVASEFLFQQSHCHHVVSLLLFSGCLDSDLLPSPIVWITREVSRLFWQWDYWLISPRTVFGTSALATNSTIPTPTHRLDQRVETKEEDTLVGSTSLMVARPSSFRAHAPHTVVVGVISDFGIASNGYTSITYLYSPELGG